MGAEWVMRIQISLYGSTASLKNGGGGGRKRKKKKHSRSRKGGGGESPLSFLMSAHPVSTTQRREGERGEKPFRMILSLPPDQQFFMAPHLVAVGKPYFSLCPGLCLPSEKQNRHHGPLGLPSTSTFLRPPRMFSARFVRLKVIRALFHWRNETNAGEKGPEKVNRQTLSLSSSLTKQSLGRERGKDSLDVEWTGVFNLVPFLSPARTQGLLSGRRVTKRKWSEGGEGRGSKINGASEKGGGLSWTDPTTDRDRVRKWSLQRDSP